MILFVFLLSLFYANYRDGVYKNKYINKDNVMLCKVISDLVEEEFYNTYTVKLKCGDKMLLYMDRNALKLEYGTQVLVEGYIELPKGKRNFGGFDYQRYLNSQNIYAIFKSQKVNIINLPKFNLIYYLRSKINNIIAQTLPKEHYALLIALLIGDTSNVPESILLSFNKSGITHLLAVSGSNVSYIIILAKLIFNKLFGKKVSNIFVILFIITYMLICGSASSVMRASIMAILIIVSEIIYTKYNVYTSIALSTLIILIYNPLMICDVGFILSYGGTIAISLLYNKINFLINKYIKIKLLSETLSITISVQIILIPIIIYYFNTLSLISIISNLFLVPITALITLAGTLLVLFGQIHIIIGKIFSYSIYILISLSIYLSNLFSNTPFSIILIPTPNIILIILYYIIIYLYFIKQFKREHIILILIILFSIFIFNNIPKSYIDINFIDVGQGDCCYIETTNRKTILIDGGGTENNDYDVGENIVLPYILDKGKKEIDLVILSHGHDDHIEGLISIAKKIKINNLMVSKHIVETEKYIELIKILNDKKTNIIYVTEGDSINIDNIILKTIYSGNNTSDINDNSLVVELIYGKSKALFTGDIGENIEDKLRVKDIDVLKVAHHGASSSCSEMFLEKVQPRISVISVGKNSFGHPSIKSINKLNKYGKVLITKDSGEIRIKMYDNGKMEYSKCIN
jgi:competence protein ComEC